ncbi:hypothetical protein [Achromobacter aloeverae]|uniref:hypothetical protein n=1 Tax=Achromobacter aloeverae TaxID=1750518 RepID=UPI001863E7AF|nr:hypothetical protein [Achromobacter aloeverae]
MIRRLLAIALLTGLAGCGTTLKPIKPDSTTGLFTTTVAVKAADIKVAERFDPAYQRMMLLKINAERPNPEFVTYFQTSIKDTGIFEKVLTKSDLETMVIEHQWQDKVSSVSDLLGLNLLSKQIGTFLIVEADARWKGGYNFEGTIQAIDASTGKTVFKSEQQAFNWDGLDVPLFRPMLNAFVLWAKGKLPDATVAAHAAAPESVQPSAQAPAQTAVQAPAPASAKNRRPYGSPQPITY